MLRSPIHHSIALETRTDDDSKPLSTRVVGTLKVWWLRLRLQLPVARQPPTWVLLFILALAVLLAIDAATHFRMISFGELALLAGARVRGWKAALPLPHPCAPCGCGVDPLLVSSCVSDAELQETAAADSLDAWAGLSRAQEWPPLQPRLGTAACRDLLRRVQDIEGLRPPSAAQGVWSTEPAAEEAGAGGSARRGPRVLFHMYWRPDIRRGDFSRAQVAAVESFLATQDLSRAMLVLWAPLDAVLVAAGLPPDPEATSPGGTHADALDAAAREGKALGAPPPALSLLFRAFPRALKWRVLHTRLQAAGSPLQGSWLLQLRDQQAWVDSDIARMVLLWHYGGVYLDLDVLLTRDLTPLLGQEWATEFSCDHAQTTLNNAVMRLEPRGVSIRRIIAMAHLMPPRLREWTYGPHTLSASYLLGAVPLKLLPWCFFHGLWCKGALPFEAILGPAPWEASAMQLAFGLHMHGAGSSEPGAGAPWADGSILATYARKHQALLAPSLQGIDAGDDPW